MHYSEAMEFARKVVKEGVLGYITTARFRGGCPSGAGMDLWQSIPEDLVGIMHTQSCHTLDSIVDLFVAPERVVSTIRKLPQRPPHLVVGWILNLFSGLSPLRHLEWEILMYKDMASAMMEYSNKTVTLNMTPWKPIGWCNEWAIDTNGSLQTVPDFPVAELYLREARGGSDAGTTKVIGNNLRVLSARVRGASAKGLDLEQECCGLVKNVKILKIIAAIYESSSSRQLGMLRLDLLR